MIIPIEFKFERRLGINISPSGSMNIIASSQPLDLGASNMRAVFAEIVSNLADRIINIETGKLHYVNGVRCGDTPHPGVRGDDAAGVKPSLTMDLGYCTINMRVYRANLVVLLPGDLSKHIAMEVIKSLVNAVSIELVKRDAELGSDAYMSDDMSFALTQCEFTPAANSFHTDNKIVQMTKRVFQYKYSTRNNLRDAAFIWEIKTNFGNLESCLQDADIWISDHVDIHVDLANLRISGLSSAALRDPYAILKHFGVAPTIVYTMHGIHNRGEPYLLPGSERKYVVDVHFGESGTNVKIKTMDLDQYARNCKKSLVLERPDNTNLLTSEQFIAEFLKGGHEISMIEPRCQMCWRRQIGFFIIEKFEKFVPTYTPVCGRCIRSDAAFVKLSEDYNVYEICLRAQFSTVSRDYGISQTHMELFECRNFGMHGYARDDVTFAFQHFSSVEAIESLGQYLDDIRARGAPVDIITRTCHQ